MTGDPLRDAVRQLLIPVSADREDATVDAVRRRLTALRVPAGDQAEHVRQLIVDWRKNGQPSPRLRDLVSDAINSGFPEGQHLARKYHETHEALQQDNVLKFGEATALLSRAPTMLELAFRHKYSASAIARVLAAHGLGSDIGWRAVRTVLAAMRASPTLTVGDGEHPRTISGVDARDKWEADERFLDAGIDAGAELVGSVAAELGFEGDLGGLLLVLCEPDGTTFTPYLQVLHFQCMVAEFYDHPVTMPYEFHPRGRNAAFLRQTYLPLTHTDSAFLNNLKAVERLDNAWARGRSQHRVRAHALVAALTGLEKMAFLPRVELAAWVRQWLVRVVELAATPTNQVPSVATAEMVEHVLAGVCGMAAGSATGGVIEQRIVDALASSIHPDAYGWRSRGLGLPVHASNLSSRRFGDCDFQRSAVGDGHPELVAYEATAGRLTKTYLDGHLQTLRRSVDVRIEELEGVADRHDWRIRIVFVAHDFASDLPPAGPLPAADYQGLSIETEYTTFQGLVDRSDQAQLPAAFTTHVHARLNEPRTPSAARARFLALLP